MGLDITAYSKLVRLARDCEDDDLPDGVTQLWVNDAFPGRADQITDGYYEYDDRHHFYAGSYGGYNEWRNDLIELAGYRKGLKDINAGDGPFSELIAFSDCEGVIGVAHCRKLARDFDKFWDKARSFKTDAHESDWFCKLYGEWSKAFKLASDDGAVEFH